MKICDEYVWARLIRKIFEVDPLRCKKCGGEMKVIAFITREKSIKRILEHMGEQTQRPPPLSRSISLPAFMDTDFGDYMPPVEVYVQDPEYAYEKIPCRSLQERSVQKQGLWSLLYTGKPGSKPQNATLPNFLSYTSHHP